MMQSTRSQTTEKVLSLEAKTPPELDDIPLQLSSKRYNLALDFLPLTKKKKESFLEAIVNRTQHNTHALTFSTK